MSFFRFIVILLSAVFLSHPIWAEEPDDTKPPEVLDIDDPFSRDLKRAADDATGGISFDDNSGLQEEEQSGRELLGIESRAAIVANKYRILGLAVSRRPHANQIYIDETDSGIVSGTKPLMNYLRIGTHETVNAARQQAINLKSAYPEYLDTSFVIRRTSPDAPVDLDLGPFKDVTHAERYCDMMLGLTFGLISDCYVVQHYPGLEALASFTSSAMVQFSTNAVAEVIEDTSVFDLPAAANQILTIREGAQLGRGSTIAAKIIPSGIIIVDEIGSVVKLPLNFIPEDPFEERIPEPVIPQNVLIEDEIPPLAEEDPVTAAEILLSTESTESTEEEN